MTRGWMLIITGAHLGQSIAYTRMNQIALEPVGPDPW